MKQKIKIAKDTTGHNIVVLPDIIFRNKQNIDWAAVEAYLRQYVGKIVTVLDTHDMVFIGADFPDEYKGSAYTKQLRGSNAKAKANAVQGIMEMLEIATDKRFSKNYKKKHSIMAGNGWYYYTTRFAIPIYENKIKTDTYNIYSACLIVNHTKFGKLYLYDLVNIKREASTPLRTTEIDEW